MGYENWKVHLQMTREFIKTINKYDDNTTLVELPKIGIKGNTHFLIQDLNNDVIVGKFGKWLKENEL